MMRRSYRPEQIIKKLREAEVLLSHGSTIGEATRKIRVDGADVLSVAQRIWWDEDWRGYPIHRT